MGFILQGLTLGLAYVAPIGMQNLYVINSAISLKASKAHLVALIVTFFDITLAITCYMGIGTLLSLNKVVNMAFIGVGGLVVLYIGYSIFNSTPELKELDMNKPLLSIAFACFAVTWMNVQAIIDGTMLLGSIKASLAFADSVLFLIGVCLASCIWFTGIVLFVRQFRQLMTVGLLKMINRVCGAVVFLYGLKILTSLFTIIHT